MRVKYFTDAGIECTPEEVSIWMWMILWINIKTDNENKKDRMIIAYPSIIM